MELNVLSIGVVVLAGVLAGGINTVVGSGSMVTFPTLIALGVPPVVANVSNTVGLVPGGISGTWGYRQELVGQGPRVLALGSATVVGSTTGAFLLLRLPSSVFDALVPVLIAIGCLLMLLQPRIAARLTPRPASGRPSRVTTLLVGATAVYGGYFGAAQGVILLAVLAVGVDDSLQRLNGTKNVLATLANLVAAVIFIATGRVDWICAGLIAVGAAGGAFLGAKYGRRLSSGALRIFVVTVGVAAIVYLLAFR